MKKLSKISLLLLSFVLVLNVVCADVVGPDYWEKDTFTVSPVILVIVGIIVAVAICALVYLGTVKKNEKKDDDLNEKNK